MHQKQLKRNLSLTFGQPWLLIQQPRPIPNHEDNNDGNNNNNNDDTTTKLTMTTTLRTMTQQRWQRQRQQQQHWEQWKQQWERWQQRWERWQQQWLRQCSPNSLSPRPSSFLCIFHLLQLLDCELWIKDMGLWILDGGLWMLNFIGSNWLSQFDSRGRNNIHLPRCTV